MRLLITGASGFVGWNAVRYFVERGIDVVASYRSLPHYLHKAGDCPAVELDLADAQAIDRVVARFQPSVILHTAAITRPQLATDPAELTTVNVDATAHLAKVAARYDAGIVFLSTDLVYPNNVGRCDESTPTSPSGAGAYSRSKLDAENAIRASSARAIILRPTLMFGDGPPRANSFSMFIEGKWSSGEPAPLFTDQYRSFLFVEDLCSAVETVTRQHEAWGELFVCGGPETISRAAFGERFAAALGVDRTRIAPLTVSQLEGYIGCAGRIDVDSSKLRSLGWRPHAIEDAVALMLRRRRVNNRTGDSDRQE